MEANFSVFQVSFDFTQLYADTPVYDLVSEFEEFFDKILHFRNGRLTASDKSLLDLTDSSITTGKFAMNM